MQLAAFFRLVRWKNLLLLIYVQLLIKLLFFTSFNAETKLSIFQFFVLLFAILLISAAGYICNDIADLKTDLINKPSKVVITKEISIEGAKRLYLITNTLGIAFGVGFCLHIQKPTYSFIFIITALLLHYYSKKLKSRPLIGNIIVSLLIAMCMLLLGLFDLNHTIQNKTQKFVILVLIGVSGFAFFLNLIREIVKDIEDMNGDYNLNMRTLPILFGRNRTKNIAAILCAIPMGLLLYIIIHYSLEYKFTVLYLLLFSLLPILYVALKLLSAKSTKDFHKLSVALKIIMFLGINSLVILSLNL